MGCTTEQENCLTEEENQEATHPTANNNPEKSSSEGEDLNTSSSIRMNKNLNSDLPQVPQKEKLNPEAPEFVPRSRFRKVPQVYKASLIPYPLMEIPVKVNGSTKTYTALIDSGAADSMVGAGVARELNLDFTPVQNVHIRGIDESSQLNTHWAAECTCEVYGNQLATERYLVVDEKYAPTDFILGRPSLWNNRMILQKDKIIVNPKEEGQNAWELEIIKDQHGKEKHVVRIHTMLKAVKQLSYDPGSYLRIMVTHEPFPNITNAWEEDIYYDGEVLEPRLKSNVLGWPGILTTDTNNIIAEVNKEATKGKIKAGDNMGKMTIERIYHKVPLTDIRVNTVIEDDNDVMASY